MNGSLRKSDRFVPTFSIFFGKQLNAGLTSVKSPSEKKINDNRTEILLVPVVQHIKSAAPQFYDRNGNKTRVRGWHLADLNVTKN